MNKALRRMLMAFFAFVFAVIWSSCVQNKEEKNENIDSVPTSAPAPARTDGVVVSDTTTKKKVDPSSKKNDTTEIKKQVVPNDTTIKRAFHSKGISSSHTAKRHAVAIQDSSIYKQNILRNEQIIKDKQEAALKKAAKKAAKEKADAEALEMKKNVLEKKAQADLEKKAQADKANQLKAEALVRSKALALENQKVAMMAKAKTDSLTRVKHAMAAKEKNAAIENARILARNKQKHFLEAKLKADSLAKATAIQKQQQFADAQSKTNQQAKDKQVAAAKARLEAQSKANAEAEEKRIAALNQAKLNAAEKIRTLTAAKAKADSMAKSGGATTSKPVLKSDPNAKQGMALQPIVNADGKGKADSIPKSGLKTVPKGSAKPLVTVKKGMDIQAMVDADAKEKAAADKAAENQAKEDAKNIPKKVVVDSTALQTPTVNETVVEEVKKPKGVLAPLNYPTDKRYEKLIDDQIYYGSEIRKEYLPEKFKIDYKNKLQRTQVQIDSMKLAVNPGLPAERKPELLKMDDRAELASMMPPVVYAHEIGSMVYGLGVSFIGPNYSFPIILSGEKTLNKKFSFGGYLGYFRENILEQGPPKNNSVYSFNTVNYSYSYYCFGAKGSYHLLNPESFLKLPGLDRMVYDLYTTASIGYNIASSPLAAIDNENYKAPQKNGLNYGLSLGMRYMFDDNFGVFAEAGYSRIGFVTAGLSYSYRKVKKKIQAPVIVPVDEKSNKGKTKNKQGVSKNKKK
jgi:hypothetical protein